MATTANNVDSDLELLEWCLNNGFNNLVYARLVINGYRSLNPLLFLSNDELQKLAKIIKLSSSEIDKFIKCILTLQKTRKPIAINDNDNKDDNKYDDSDSDCGGLDDDDDDILTLKMYGQTFEIDKKSAELSKFITTILEGDADATSIELRGMGMSGCMNSSAAAAVPTPASNNDNDDVIGLSVGGSKDVNNFRDNINNGRMPKENSITYNGLLYEYYFDTMSNRQTLNNNNNNQSPLFYPSYCYGKQYNSIKNEYKHYMSIGLNSNIKQNQFQRKALNLCVVLDQSGSMGYIDNKWNDNKTKMNTANDAVITLLSHLNDNDRFGLISFDNETYLHQTLQYMKDININNLKNKIQNIQHSGGTNFEIGYNHAIQLYDKMFNDILNQKYNDIIINDDNDNDITNEYENRIIFITDACPNLGLNNPQSLMNLVEKRSENVIFNQRIYTTFIGVGLDFNSGLIEKISKIRGSNYFSVQSSKQFMETMNQEFDYMVTPLVFNVCLTLKSEGNGCCIKRIYGINNEKEREMIKNGEIQKICTLFPAKRIKKGSIKQTKGGLILIELVNNNIINNNNNNYNVEMAVYYEDRNGGKYSNKQMVTLGAAAVNNNNYYDNLGIRKAILLCNYVSIIKEWIKDDGTINYLDDLKVSAKWKKIFGDLIVNFKKEIAICNDKELQKEIDLLQKLIHK